MPEVNSWQICRECLANAEEHIRAAQFTNENGQFFVPKQISVRQLWGACWHVSSLFAASLNIGTFGVFWWYLPLHVSRFYEEIVDLESKAKVVLERTPSLTVNWGGQVLRERELINTATVMTHLWNLDDKSRTPYSHYLRSMTLLAKNDIFQQFENNCMEELYLALREGLQVYRDWDGTGSFEDALQRCLSDLLLTLMGVT